MCSYPVYCCFTKEYKFYVLSFIYHLNIDLFMLKNLIYNETEVKSTQKGLKNSKKLLLS